MYTYRVSQGNPEGTDYSLMLQHEQLFTPEQFQEICEQAMVDTLNKECESSEYVSLSSLDSRTLFNILKKKGFSRLPIATEYYLEPYWDKDSIKNPELLEWANGKTIDKGEKV